MCSARVMRRIGRPSTPSSVATPLGDALHILRRVAAELDAPSAGRALSAPAGRL